MTDPKDRPSTEERYTSATHATSLIVDTEHHGAGDVLIAAAWSPSRLGSALMRLHSEFDGAEKPRRLDQSAIAQLARAIAREHKRVVPNDSDMREARTKAGEWLLHEQKIQLGKLKTLPEVRAQLLLWAREKDFYEPQALAANVLTWWLDPTCPVCHGRRWQVIEGTPALSERSCPACKGSGERARPGGLEGGALQGYIDDCINRARASMRQRLRHSVAQKNSTS